MRVAFYTLGCKVNQYETDLMMKSFVDNGYEICDFKICMGGGTYMYVTDLIYKFKQNNFDRKICQKIWSHLR